MDKKFKEYYYKYLNYEGNDNIISSADREESINGIYYPIIVSFIDEKIIYSIAPKYFKEFKEKLIEKNINKKNDVIEFIKNFFETKNKNVTIQEMLRMTKKAEKRINISEVNQISERNRQEYYNCFKYNKDIEYKKTKWENLKKLKYLNGIIENNQIVSIGFVSNITYNGANIVIETKENYRNNGYGKKIVEKISRDLLRNKIMPIYWVNVENKASKRLAENLLFEQQAVEIIVKVI